MLVGAMALAIVLTFLTLGFFGPFVVLTAVIFAVIGLQYLVWGWWFERVYRGRTPSDRQQGLVANHRGKLMVDSSSGSSLVPLYGTPWRRSMPARCRDAI